MLVFTTQYPPPPHTHTHTHTELCKIYLTTSEQLTMYCLETLMLPDAICLHNTALSVRTELNKNKRYEVFSRILHTQCCYCRCKYNSEQIFSGAEIIRLQNITATNILIVHKSVHNLYTICAQSVHNLCTISTQSVHNLCTISTQSVHNLCTICTQSVHNLCTICTQSVHNLCTICTKSAHNLCKICTQSVHNLCTFSIR